MLVPRATNVIAVTLSLSPTRQPNIEAKSPTMAVKKPMRPRDTKNVSQPLKNDGGGTKANNSYNTASYFTINYNLYLFSFICLLLLSIIYLFFTRYLFIYLLYYHVLSYIFI